MTTIAQRVLELGHRLPDAAAPVANYVSTVRTGNLLFVSGQISGRVGESAFVGRVGAELSAADGRRAAEVAALGVLAQIVAATDGSLSVVRRIVRLGVFIASATDFTEHAQVANGASDLVVRVLGDAGRHARAAVGVATLPSGAAVEVDAIIELAGD